MNNENILLEWNIYKSYFSIKRNYSATIILVFIVFIVSLNFINIWIALVCGFLVLHMVTKYYVNMQSKYRNVPKNNDVLMEKYQITDKGIIINNLASDHTLMYEWLSMDCFYSKAGTIFSSIIYRMFGGDIIIECKNKQKIRLRCNAHIIFDVVKILAQKLPHKNIAKNTKERLNLVDKENSINKDINS